MNRIKKIIGQLGKKVQINGHNAVAVIYPIRKSKVSGGGIGSSDSGRVDPHLYILFTELGERAFLRKKAILRRRSMILRMLPFRVRS